MLCGLILVAVLLVGGVVGYVSAADDLAPYGLLMTLRIGAHKIDDFALKQREEQSIGDGIVAVVLFQDSQAAAVQIAQHHGVRLGMGGDVAEGGVGYTAIQLQRNRLADNGKLLVVNGERRRFRLRSPS